MCSSRALVVAVLLHALVALVSGQGSETTKPWQTLSGDAPFVVARGGFPGIFPDSSISGYTMALLISVPDLILWCDVQLTKDSTGICYPDINLNNASNIASLLPNMSKEYLVNGVSTKGWFSLDFTLEDLAKVGVSLVQGLYSRTQRFDSLLEGITTPEEVSEHFKPPGLWLNIQHDAFYTQHNLSMRSYVLAMSRKVIVSYISSPEVSFLKSIASRFKPSTTKLVLRFLGPDEIDPSTNQTYGSLLKNLSLIKTFASGIMVPKNYIRPVDSSLYSLPPTSLVQDAHKAGLEVFASDFMNDVPFSFNYSYDPVTEYLAFIDNGAFSVDGVLSDFPATPSEAIDCFSHLGKGIAKEGHFTVISKYGASGDYPGCTDLAYQKAISDGVDVLDCPVQMTKDGVPFCLSSIDLINSTTVARSSFNNLVITIPQIKAASGIYAFNLTWSQIQTLKPAIQNPASKYSLYRNPKFKNAGSFVTLSDFLALTKKSSSLSGVLINIENAAYLAEKEGLDVIGSVLSELTKAGYTNQTAQKVMIQSTSSSVLKKVKSKTNYEIVYELDETVRDALNSTVEDIKKFADSVVVSKTSVFPLNLAFVTGQTNVIAKLQAFKLPVYVQTLSNEFTTQPWDFFSDSTAEITAYVLGALANGVITDFPLTATRYRRNRCLDLGNSLPVYMSPADPGSLMKIMTPMSLPPAQAPLPILEDSDVAATPFPAVVAKPPTSSSDNRNTTAGPKPSNGQHTFAASLFSSVLAMILVTLSLF